MVLTNALVTTAPTNLPHLSLGPSCPLLACPPPAMRRQPLLPSPPAGFLPSQDPMNCTCGPLRASLSQCDAMRRNPSTLLQASSPCPLFLFLVLAVTHLLVSSQAFSSSGLFQPENAVLLYESSWKRVFISLDKYVGVELVGIGQHLCFTSHKPVHCFPEWLYSYSGLGSPTPATSNLSHASGCKATRPGRFMSHSFTPHHDDHFSYVYCTHGFLGNVPVHLLFGQSSALFCSWSS